MTFAPDKGSFWPGWRMPQRKMSVDSELKVRTRCQALENQDLEVLGVVGCWLVLVSRWTKNIGRVKSVATTDETPTTSCSAEVISLARIFRPLRGM